MACVPLWISGATRCPSPLQRRSRSARRRQRRRRRRKKTFPAYNSKPLGMNYTSYLLAFIMIVWHILWFTPLSSIILINLRIFIILLYVCTWLFLLFALAFIWRLPSYLPTIIAIELYQWPPMYLYKCLQISTSTIINMMKNKWWIRIVINTHNKRIMTLNIREI